MATNHLNVDSIIRTLLLAGALVLGAWFMFGTNSTATVAPSYENTVTSSAHGEGAAKTEKVCVGGNCVNVTTYNSGDDRPSSSGFQWEGNLFDECKAKGLHLYEELTPDKKDHAGYHCAP